MITPSVVRPADFILKTSLYKTMHVLDVKNTIGSTSMEWLISIAQIGHTHRNPSELGSSATGCAVKD